MEIVDFITNSPQNIENPFEMIYFLRRNGYSDEEIAYKMYYF